MEMDARQSGPLSTDRVFHEIRMNFGDSVLQDGSRLIACFRELAPEKSKEGVLLEALVAIDGHKALLNAVPLSADAQYQLLASIISRLNSQRGIAMDAASDFCNAFFRGIGGTAQFVDSSTQDRATASRFAMNADSRVPASEKRKKKPWMWVKIAVFCVIIAAAAALLPFLLNTHDPHNGAATMSTNSTSSTNSTNSTNSSNATEPQNNGENNNSFKTAHATLFSSGERIINYNDIIYTLEADGLYCYGDEKKLVFGEQLDIWSGFCTDGHTAYVMAKDGRILRIDVETGTSTELFTDKNVLKIIGCDNHSASHSTSASSEDPLLYLGYANEIAGGDSWGYDLCSVFPDGSVCSNIAEGVEAQMMNGILLYYNYRSDVSPTVFSTVSEKQNLSGVTVPHTRCLSLCNNILYYGKQSLSESVYSVIELHKNIDGTDTIFATNVSGNVIFPGSESDVIEVSQDPGETGYSTMCLRLSLEDGRLVFPQLVDLGSVYLDRCTGIHYFIPREIEQAPKVLTILDAEGNTAYATELPSASSRCLLIHNGWIYYLADYSSESVQRLRLGP